MKIIRLFFYQTLLFVIFLAIAPLSHSYAATYYVDTAGSDNNDGASSSTPWQTIGKVNSVNFAAGDSIQFKGGQTFSGSLYFDTQDTGTAVNPLIITSYATGRATISSTSNGIFAYNTAGITINNLNFDGGNHATNTGSGINVYADTGAIYSHIYIDNVDTYKFGKPGIMIGSWNGSTTKFDDIRITNVASYDNEAGIATYGQTTNLHTNVYVGHATVYNNSGTCITPTKPGQGIVLGSVNGGTIERSISHNNTSACHTGGPAGIWTYDSNNVIIQYNESYNNKTGGTEDGDGFDLDQDVSNSTIQYNYSHDNDGAGYLLAQPRSGSTAATGNVIRYNISENDGRKNNYAAIHVWGKWLNTEIYNNTIYISSSATQTPKAVKIVNDVLSSTDVTQNMHIRNNIFQITSGIPLVEVSANQVNNSTGMLFQGNNYYTTGSSFVIMWGGTNYTSLSSWRNATAQEKNGSNDTGYSNDPLLTNPGNGGTIGNADNLATLTAYQTKMSSPMIDAGLDLNALFGVNPGPFDFWGNSLPKGTAYDIGAHEHQMFVHDSFTGSDTTLASHIGEVGATWTSRAGTAKLTSSTNRVRTNSNFATQYYASGTPSSAEYTVAAGLYVASNSGYTGIVARLNPSLGSYYSVRYDNASKQWKMIKRASGTDTNLGTYSQTLTVGNTYKIKFEVKNATKSLFIKSPSDTDYVLRISSSNNDLTNIGKVGVLFNYSGTPSDAVSYHLDNFLAME